MNKVVNMTRFDKPFQKNEYSNKSLTIRRFSSVNYSFQSDTYQFVGLDELILVFPVEASSAQTMTSSIQTSA